MTINLVALLVVILVSLARVAEIVVGEVNARRMLLEGGKEFASWQRTAILIVYTLWLALLLKLVPPGTKAIGYLMGIFFLLQVGRWWSIVHLGKYWTTRVIVVPGASKITTGPYRFVSHPIYGVLIAEVLILSLALRQPALGCVFTGITAGWVFLRMRAESAALRMMR